MGTKNTTDQTSAKAASQTDDVIEGQAVVRETKAPPKSQNKAQNKVAAKKVPSKEQKQRQSNSGLLIGALLISCGAVALASYGLWHQQNVVQNLVSHIDQQAVHQRQLEDKLAALASDVQSHSSDQNRRLADLEDTSQNIGDLEKKVLNLQASLSNQAPRMADEAGTISVPLSLTLAMWQSAKQGQPLSPYLPLLSYLPDDAHRQTLTKAIREAGDETHRSLLREADALRLFDQIGAAQPQEDPPTGGIMDGVQNWLAKLVNLREVAGDKKILEKEDQGSSLLAEMPQNLSLLELVEAAQSSGDKPSLAWVSKAKGRLSAETVLEQLLLAQLAQISQDKTASDHKTDKGSQ